MSAREQELLKLKHTGYSIRRPGAEYKDKEPSMIWVSEDKQSIQVTNYSGIILMIDLVTGNTYQYNPEQV